MESRLARILLRFRAFRTEWGEKLRDGFGYIQTIYGRRNSHGSESSTREYCS